MKQPLNPKLTASVAPIDCSNETPEGDENSISPRHLGETDKGNGQKRSKKERKPVQITVAEVKPWLRVIMNELKVVQISHKQEGAKNEVCALVGDSTGCIELYSRDDN